MLIEEFKNCVPERTAVYLNEQKVNTVQQAAVLADEYALMHKPVFVKRSFDSGHTSQKENEVSSYDEQIKPSPSGPKFRKECGYCHKVGHVIAECRILKRKQERSDSSVNQPRGSVLVKVVSQQPVTSVVPDACFQPFVFDGLVSLTDRVEDQRAVKILRDTGGSQSFILPNSLPFDAESACGTSTIVQGIEMGFVPVPLYRVWVSSDLVTGCFNVTVHSSLPVQGVDFIMGNDIARGKVMPVMHVTNTLLTDPQPDGLAESFPNVFAVSAVTTRAQAKRVGKENEMNLGESIFKEILETEAFPESLEAPKSILKPMCPDPDVFLLILCSALTDAQKSDPTLEKCRLSADSNMLPLCNHQFYWSNTVLMRRWSARPLSEDVQNEWNVVHQIVVPF